MSKNAKVQMFLSLVPCVLSLVFFFHSGFDIAWFSSFMGWGWCLRREYELCREGIL